MSTKQEVEHVAVVPAESTANVLPITFAPIVRKNVSEKAPTHSYMFPNRGLPGTMLVGNISKDAKSGQYRVRLPGESQFGDAIICAKDAQVVNGRTFYDDNDQGRVTLLTFPDKIRTAFLVYLQTGKAEQLISLQ